MRDRAFFGFLACTFLLLTAREPPHADGRATLLTAAALVDRHALDVREPLISEIFRNGKRYGIAPPGNILAQVPGYMIYKVARLIPGMPDRPLYSLTAHLAPALLMAGAALLLRRLLRRFGMTEARSLGVSLVLAFCTLSFVQSRLTYCEALQTFAVTWLVERAIAVGDAPTAARFLGLGSAAGILLNAKPAYALVLPFAAAYPLVRLRAQIDRAFWRRACAGLAVFAFFAALLCAHNYAKTGSITDVGYRNEGGIFSGSFGEGLYGLLLSSGKGMFWYSPPLLLVPFGIAAVWRRFRLETLLILGVAGTTILFSAKFRYWHGDWAWGPRYVGPLNPILLVLALPAFDRIFDRGYRHVRAYLLLGTLWLGLGVNLLGASLFWDHYIRVLITIRPGHLDVDNPHGHFIPSFSPLIGQWWILKHVIRHDPNMLADAPFAQHIIGTPPLGRLHELPIDWWLLEWYSLGPRPRAIASGIASLWLAGIAASLWDARRTKLAVGLVRSTDEVAEGSAARGAKGPARGDSV